jgi:hypothetical protein
MKIQIKHRFNSSILFEHECENNTIKETLIQGLKANADLSGSDLSYCNLSGSDLSGSDLSYCILRGSNLSNCDLSYCILSGSDLSNCYLSGSDLSGSDLSYCILRGSNLSNCNLSNCNLPIFAKWSFSIKNNQIIKIGCKEKTVDDWDLWFASTEEFDTKRGTPEFKQIEAMYLAHKAYLTHLNL